MPHGYDMGVCVAATGVPGCLLSIGHGGGFGQTVGHESKASWFVDGTGVAL